jgi:hypothetical protein
MRKLYAAEERRRYDAINATPLVEVEAQLVCLRTPQLHIVGDCAGKWGRREGSAPMNRGFRRGQRVSQPRISREMVCGGEMGGEGERPVQRSMGMCVAGDGWGNKAERLYIGQPGVPRRISPLEPVLVGHVDPAPSSTA